MNGNDDRVRSMLNEAAMHAEARVVLIHGTLDRGMAFRGVVQRLHRYDVLVYDRRGYGASVAVPPSDDLAVQVDDLRGVIDGEPAVVIGHSFGGLIALRFAAEHPELVSALGVFEPPVPASILEPEPLDVPPPENLDDTDATVEWMYRYLMSDEEWDGLREGARNAILAEGPGLLADMRSARRVGSGSDAGDAAQAFDAANFAVPTLVGHGSDTDGRHRRRAEALEAALATAEMRIIDGAGHMAHRTHAAEFAGFVEETVARSRP